MADEDHDESYLAWSWNESHPEMLLHTLERYFRVHWNKENFNVHHSRFSERKWAHVRDYRHDASGLPYLLNVARMWHSPHKSASNIL